MDHETQVALLRRLFGFEDERSTQLAPAPYVNAVSSYTSPVQLERERALLFDRQPLFVGLSADLGAPGAYLVHSNCGVPLLVLRTRSGELHACLALCRHRGAPVVTGAGMSSGHFVCPYHGWTYDERGRLVAQPCAEGFTGLPADALSLPPLPVVERYGMIFICGTAGAPIDIDAHLGGAQRELAPLGLAQYAPFARRETRRAMNWKLVVDTFLEAYHVSHLHRRSLGPTILGSPAAWDSFGRGGRLVAARRSVAALRRHPEREWNLLDHAVILYLLFPNTILIHQVDHIEIVQAHPGPDGPETTTVVYALYTPEPASSDAARAHYQANFDLLLEITENEDFRLGEQIQRGFHAPGHEHVIYGRNEPGLVHYHRTINAALANDRAGPSA